MSTKQHGTLVPQSLDSPSIPIKPKTPEEIKELAACLLNLVYQAPSLADDPHTRGKLTALYWCLYDINPSQAYNLAYHHIQEARSNV